MAGSALTPGNCLIIDATTSQETGGSTSIPFTRITGTCTPARNSSISARLPTPATPSTATTRPDPPRAESQADRRTASSPLRPAKTTPDLPAAALYDTTCLSAAHPPAARESAAKSPTCVAVDIGQRRRGGGSNGGSSKLPLDSAIHRPANLGGQPQVLTWS